MVYANNKQFSERSGLGLRVIDETVGTGSGTIQSFDLDNDNIITGTYTFRYGTATEALSNILTDLTEDDDYTLDKESGRVLTTGTGDSKIQQDVIYATYTHIDAFSDGTITDLLNNARDQVDKLTGRNWGSGTSVVEYRDGRRNLSKLYPTTDRPYAKDWDQPDHIVLKKWPVTKIDQVFFLASNQPVTKFFNNNVSSGTFRDHTDAVNSSTTTPFNLFDSAPANNDKIYIGSSIPFMGIDINLSTLGVGASTIDWEYYNGATWADITETETDTGASTFLANGKFTWSYPYGWNTTSVNSNVLYWIRGTLTDSYTTDPICATMNIKDSLSVILEPRNILFKDNGILNFMGVNVPDGQLNVRIDYSYGLSVTPKYITELEILLASEQAFLNITGSSYDEATGYQLGTKQIQIGEAWVNVKQVLQEIRIKIKSILDMIGKRGDIAVI